MHLLCRGSGPAILFIHGMPTSNELWSGIIERMCGQFTCFAIDLPGLGSTRSEPYGPGYLARMAVRIETLRIANQIPQWHVVGHDAGSAVAVRYTHAFPASVARLALLAPALFPELKPYYLLELLRKPILGELLAPAVNPIFWKIVMERAARNEEGAPALACRRFRPQFFGVDGSWRFMRVLRWGKPAEVLSEIPLCLPKLLAPTLIFYGARDPAIPESFATRAAALIPNAELVRVDCGHFIPLNRPGFVAGRLGEFLGDGAECREKLAMAQ